MAVLSVAGGFKKNEIVGVSGQSGAEMQVAEYFRVFSYELRRGCALIKKQPGVSSSKRVFLGSSLLVPEVIAGGGVRAIIAGGGVRAIEFLGSLKKQRRKLP